MISVAKTIEPRISLEALKMTEQDGLRRGRLGVLLQPSEDVLDVHDRVVHQLADGDRQAAERHRVDVMPNHSSPGSPRAAKTESPSD